MLRADSRSPQHPIILTQPTPTTRRQTLAPCVPAPPSVGQRLDAEELLLRLAASPGQGRRPTAPGPRPGGPRHQLYNGAAWPRGCSSWCEARAAARHWRASPSRWTPGTPTALGRRVARVLRETGRTSDALTIAHEVRRHRARDGADAALLLAERLAAALTGRPRRRIGRTRSSSRARRRPRRRDAEIHPGTLLAHASALPRRTRPAAGRFAGSKTGYGGHDRRLWPSCCMLSVS